MQTYLCIPPQLDKAHGRLRDQLLLKLAGILHPRQHPRLEAQWPTLALISDSLMLASMLICHTCDPRLATLSVSSYTRLLLIKTTSCKYM